MPLSSEALLLGAKVHYEMTGTGSCRVLCLHGWGCDGKIFAPILSGMGDQYTFLCPDFPGHGASSDPPEPWDVPRYGQCIVELIGQLGFSPCHVIAHSFGGRIALWLAANHPELVQKMILTGCAGLRKPKTEEQIKKEKAFKQKKAFLKTLKNLPLVGQLAEGAEERLRQKYGSEDYKKLNEVMRRTFVKVISLDLRPVLSVIRASTLLIWGSEDGETPLWMGQAMEQEIPDAGLVIFDGDDHFAFVKQWQRFCLIADRYLRPNTDGGERIG